MQDEVSECEPVVNVAYDDSDGLIATGESFREKTIDSPAVDVDPSDVEYDVSKSPNASSNGEVTEQTSVQQSKRKDTSADNSDLVSLDASEERMQNEISNNEPDVIGLSDDSYLPAVHVDLSDVEFSASNSPDASSNEGATEQTSVQRSKRKNTSEDNSDSENSRKNRRVKDRSASVRVGKDGKHSSKNLLKCDYPLCTYIAIDNFRLKRHMLTHSNVKPYKCEICPKEFTRKDRLKEHAEIHKRHLNFKCLKCTRRFETHEDRVSHETKCIKKRFECYVCPYSSIRSAQLVTHFHKIHIGVKKLKCLHCLK